MYDWLDTIENVSAVELPHPYRVRAIAAAQVKTDSIDSHTLAQLLRVNLIPRAYVPGSATRRLREVVRQRVFLVRMRTMVKNRIQALLARHHVPLPAVSDIFGKRGRDYLSKVQLEGTAQELLRQDLELLAASARRFAPPKSGSMKRARAIVGSSSCARSRDSANFWRRWWLWKSTALSASRAPPNSPPTPGWCRPPILRAGTPSMAS